MPLKVEAPVAEIFSRCKSELEGDKNFCAVIAIAAITRRPAKEIQVLLTKHGRKHGKGTPTWIIEKVIDELGFRFVRWPPTKLREIIDSYPGRAVNLENITTHHPRRFPSAWAGQPDMLMFSRSHVSAFVDGKVEDWAIEHSKQVYMIWTLEPKVEEFRHCILPSYEGFL